LVEKKGRGLFCCCVLVGEKDGRMRVDEKLVEENVENGWLSMADAVLVVGWGVGFRLPILCLGRRVHRRQESEVEKFAHKPEKEKICQN
jgi:hypothetical protein